MSGRLVLLAAVVGLCGGCVTLKPASVSLATPDAAIEAEDGSFRIESGRPADAPFHLRCPATFVETWPEGSVRELHSQTLRSGARKVKVTVGGRPLFGVLAFCDLHHRASGPGARSYEVRIPEEYVAAAAGGRVSVVYELVDVAGSGTRQYGWLLWLSDRPFTG